MAARPACRPGSGQVDRDSNVGRLRMNLGAPLARTLARHGIAAFRYDRRGVGATPGDWAAVGFTDNRADAAAALRALRARPEIRADAVGVLDEVGAVGAVGHSEGGGARDMAGRARATGRRGAARRVRRRGRPARYGQAAGTLPAPVRVLLPVVRRLAVRQLAAVEASTADTVRIGGTRVNARWWREQLGDDPRADLPRITAPLLAITVDKDLQVAADDLATIASLTPSAEVYRMPDLTHVLRRDPGNPSLLSYRRLPRPPVDAQLLDGVAGWLAQRLR